MIDTSVFQDKKAVYYTLGCKLNFSETSTIGQMLKEAGVRTVRKGEKADICVVNTCSVTEVADKKCRQAIHRLVKNHPGAFVVVTGCYAQLKPEQVASIEGVDVVLGAEQKGDLMKYLGNLQKHDKGEAVTSALKDIRSFAPSCSRGDRTRYFLKVQDGCDYYCSYCTIPFARGRSRNGKIADIVAQARQAAAEGGKEIVITGVNIGDFGKTTGESFYDLVQELDRVEGIERYRISSIEPNLLTDEIIEFVARSRAFMPHFHIPLQSGCDEVLKLMRRRYDTALFAHKIQKIKQVMPHAFIGVDVIVGTRGETEEYFNQAYEFLKGLDVTQLHVFSYSERPGTMALKIEHVVSPEEKHRRSQLLLALSDEKTQAFYASHIGQEAVVLMEKSKAGTPMHGFTDNYIRVEMEHDDALDNQLLRVRLGEFNEDGTALMATIIE
ncbi:MAG: tRNA (N(6)-L-threonylcarbamoyladenosine(37)-C(2))-methylthiotransferase MtaB [Bacteroides sp.]|nr:tRNA (N(6)-L-threonylcarbamoyladenosine(37)-C(2))-methylthiotransferase MtaB [Bacteroidaceae bacterium]MBQ8874957.1 tRNA (N(6)-L-threonylcarbamoyladenosine(37)-C(2))-methylthiotransferase MtaB [Bacteroides sp.]